jgi:hypothetical protein
VKQTSPCAFRWRLGNTFHTFSQTEPRVVNIATGPRIPFQRGLEDSGV